MQFRYNRFDEVREKLQAQGFKAIKPFPVNFPNGGIWFLLPRVSVEQIPATQKMLSKTEDLLKIFCGHTQYPYNIVQLTDVKNLNAIYTYVEDKVPTLKKKAPFKTSADNEESLDDDDDEEEDEDKKDEDEDYDEEDDDSDEVSSQDNSENEDN